MKTICIVQKIFHQRDDLFGPPKTPINVSHTHTQDGFSVIFDISDICDNVLCVCVCVLFVVR